MIKAITQFKSVIQGIENTFHFDASCPIGIAKEAVFEALKWLGQIEDQIKAQEEEKKEQDQPPEGPVEPQTQEVNNEQPS